MQIEHVGSTSIPGLIAKPVLDIDIIVQTPDDLEAVRAALVSANYAELGDWGVPGRLAFRQPGFMANPKDGGNTTRDDTGEKEMRQNTYVSLESSMALKNHLDVKRILLHNDALRDEYAELKRALAGRVDTTQDYTREKTDFLVKVLDMAGWDESEMEKIRANERL